MRQVPSTQDLFHQMRYLIAGLPRPCFNISLSLAYFHHLYLAQRRLSRKKWVECWRHGSCWYPSRPAFYYPRPKESDDEMRRLVKVRYSRRRGRSLTSFLPSFYLLLDRPRLPLHDSTDLPCPHPLRGQAEYLCDLRFWTSRPVFREQTRIKPVRFGGGLLEMEAM